MNAPKELRTVSLRHMISTFPKDPKTKERNHALFRDLLANGDLKAGFHYCNRWVYIPNTYWRDNVSDEKFRSILKSKTDRRLKGSYRVRIATFYSQYLELLKKESSSKNPGHLLGELATALANSSELYEVSVLESDWESYCKNNTHLQPKEEGRRGRRQNEQWREVATILAAYGMKCSAEPQRDYKTLAVQKYIQEQAKKIGATDIPSPRSIEVVVAEARKLANGSKG